MGKLGSHLNELYDQLVSSNSTGDHAEDVETAEKKAVIAVASQVLLSFTKIMRERVEATDLLTELMPDREEQSDISIRSYACCSLIVLSSLSEVFVDNIDAMEHDSDGHAIPTDDDLRDLVSAMKANVIATSDNNSEVFTFSQIVLFSIFSPFEIADEIIDFVESKIDNK